MEDRRKMATNEVRIHHDRRKPIESWRHIIPNENITQIVEKRVEVWIAGIKHYNEVRT
jgi:hypothetical protein